MELDYFSEERNNKLEILEDNNLRDKNIRN